MIHHGDLFDVLPTLDAESIDAGVTDPPYGIGFMGREWDTFRPDVPRKQADRLVKGEPIVSDNPNLNGRRRSPAISESQIFYDRTLSGQRAFQEWTERWALEVLRVLKPGAYLIVCGAPRSYHRMACGIEDAGFEIRDGLQWLFGQGFPKSKNLGDGWGTALKPGYEPIVLARKPFKGSTTANVERYGVGGINVDGCRIDIVGESPSAKRRRYGFALNTERAAESEANGRLRDRSDPAKKATPNPADDLGRWPANLILDEDAATMLDEQSGELVSGTIYAGVQCGKMGRNGIYSSSSGVALGRDYYSNSGGASRFYYVAKPSREERDLGGRNIHPTVKPLALMRWLVRLVTPLGGTVLDPFMGSGTTGMACAAEGFEFIGIEREAEYVAIAERRIRSIAPLFTEITA